MAENSLASAIARATAEARDGDYYLEESKKREIAYSNQAFGRWNDTLDIARRYLGDLHKKTVLDVGVSPFTLALTEHFLAVSGLDLTNAFASRCVRRGVKLIHGGVHEDVVVESIPMVDCIFFLEAIEHLHVNPVEVLTRLKKRLRPEGALIVSTCNMMCLGNRLRMLFNRKLRHFDYPPFQQPAFSAHGFGHDRVYCPAELREYMFAAGCARVDCLYPLAGDANLVGSGRMSPSSILSYLAKRLMPSLRDTMLFVGR